MKILLVDDDQEITQLIGNKLTQENFAVETASNGEYAIALLHANPYSLVLLDVMLPKLSGIEVCQTLRNQGNQTPILMLTGKDNTQDKVMALDAGADDYLVKPVALDELTARVRALLRRNAETAPAILEYGSLRFDPSTQTLTHNGALVTLRPKELAILELMMRYPMRTFSPEALLDQLWKLTDCPSKDTIKTHIRSLRKHLAGIGAHNVIETLYARGYRLNPLFLTAHGVETNGVETNGVETNGVETNGVETNGVEHSVEAHTLETHTVELPATTDKMIQQTWQQVQMTSWQRLMQLKQLVRSLSPSRLDTPPAMACWQATCQQAIDIAHQLKGNLGSFGFLLAAAQAKRIEQLLNVQPFSHPNPADSQSANSLLNEVNHLQQLLQPHINFQSKEQIPLSKNPLASQSISPATRSPEITLPAKNSYALIVSRDIDWRHQWQQHISTKLRICSPLELNSYLLDNTPAVILLDLSPTEQTETQVRNQAERQFIEQTTELNLLSVLVRNYHKQVPLLGVVGTEQTKTQQLAIQQGAAAMVLKTWSVPTLLTIIAEYTKAVPANSTPACPILPVNFMAPKTRPYVS